jgi:tetratricopeptide (TPR) repeat protein
VDDAREALRDARPRSEKVFVAWRDLVEAFPSHLGVRLDLIDAQLDERQVDSALEEISRLLNVPNVPIEELVKRVEQMLHVAPEYGPALFGLADVHHAARDWIAEIEACRRILRLAPHEADQILARLDVILAEAPDCLDASLEVIRLVDLHQDFDRVGKEARHALDLVTADADLARIADTLMELEDDFDRDVPYREAFAEALRRAGRSKKAVQAHGLLLALAPERAASVSEGVRLLTEGEGPETNSAYEVLFESVLREGNSEAACEAASTLLERRPDDVAGAYRKFSRVLEAHEESHAAADGKARTAVLKEDPDNAVKAFLHDLRFHPDRRREVGQSLGELREQFADCAAVPLARAEYIHLPLSLLGDAADDLEAALAIDPSLHRKVLRLADTILERDPLLPRGHRARGKALTAAADPTAATAAFVRMAELHPDRFPDALEGLDAVLSNTPGHVEARYRRGRVLLDLERPEDAVEQAESLVASLRPGEEDEYRALVLLAEAREALELYDDALAALRDANERHPKHLDVVPLIRANRVVALEHRAELLRNAPDEARPDADMDLADTLLAIGRPESALAAVGPIPEKGKPLARWKVIRGKAFLALGRGAAALSELEDALRVRGIQDGKSSVGLNALYVAGRAYLDTGEKVKAIRRMEQVAGVDPQFGRVREALDIIYDEDRRELDRPLEFTVPLESIPEPRRV